MKSYSVVLLCCTYMAIFVACTDQGQSTPGAQAPAMVYEGMPSSDLRKVLGEPDSIVGGSTIYDVEASRKKDLERWHYPKRVVVLIDDTVKVPNQK